MQFLLKLAFLVLAVTSYVHAGTVDANKAQEELNKARESGDEARIKAAEAELERATRVQIGGAAAMVIPIIGWIVGGSTLIAGEEVENASTMNCWQQILHSTELSKEQTEEYVASGLPLPVLLQHADYAIIPREGEEPKCIFRNKQGERFVVAPSYMKEEVVVTHATPYYEQKLLQ